MEPGVDPARDLETIRTLMERARRYRHPPAAAAFAAGALACGAAVLTEQAVGGGALAPALPQLAAIWGTVFLIALAAVVALTYVATRREGLVFWSPLAVDVLHALWPPLVAALAITGALAHAGKPELIPAVWMLCYGIGGISAGTFAVRAVRVFGVIFLLCGLAKVFLPEVGPAVSLGATFGLLHFAYGLVLILRPSWG